ncbi:unnamed protein product [Heligmosomoides polygyrus]|uniref:HTH_48 domain-containing protein n=1 Tax=Heligmosomoides polygyrus TaxID=6339 RepID=A0A183FDH0_HELPZ|nr:unnamed protein product [Heligmosomoides polygyrus]
MKVIAQDKEEIALSIFRGSGKSAKSENPQFECLQRKIARDIGANLTLVHRKAKKNRAFKPYKFPELQLLTDKNKRERLHRCCQLKLRAAGHVWKRTLFMGEKPHNRQNGRI